VNPLRLTTGVAEPHAGQKASVVKKIGGVTSWRDDFAPLLEEQRFTREAFTNDPSL
jgi:hypothetical protein